MTGEQRAVHSSLVLKGTNEQGKYLTGYSHDRRAEGCDPVNSSLVLVLKGTNEQGKYVYSHDGRAEGRALLSGTERN
jgi:hypothetical protein